MDSVAVYVSFAPDQSQLFRKFAQVCWGLIKGVAYLHKFCIARRDIKPRNPVGYHYHIGHYQLLALYRPILLLQHADADFLGFQKASGALPAEASIMAIERSCVTLTPQDHY